MNFVYCLDKNYNDHAFLSITSLLEKVHDECNIYIIHKTPKSFKEHLTVLKKLFSQHNLKIIKFQYKIGDYPKLKNAHVSEATYYRLFIDKHISENVDFITYIDSDAYILDSPEILLKALIEELSNKDIPLAAKTTDQFQLGESLDIFERLNINKKYFNAGVLVINLKEWRAQSIGEKLRKKVFELEESIVYWDQDILNAQFNGDYVELGESLNFLIDVNTEKSQNFENIKIIHYVGKLKPWDHEAKVQNINSFYLTLHRKYLKKKYLSKRFKFLTN